MDDNRKEMLNLLLLEADEKLLGSLSDYRKSRGLSLYDVAKRMGIPPFAVQALEYRTSDPSLSMIRKYALALGVRVRHETIDFSSSEV